MADNNKRFGLRSIGSGVRKRVEELRHQDSANVRSVDEKGDDDGPMQPFTYHGSDYDRTEAPKDEMRKYWRQYETTPLLRNSISSFASQVTEPGYYIEAKDLDDEQLRDLDHWLNRSSYIEGEPGKDFRLLIKKATIQREVRGTALIEKAPSSEDEDKIAALKLINPETMEAVTRPGQAILLDPEDLDRFDDAPEAESGGAAAYLQDLAETDTFFGQPVAQDEDDDFKVGFQRDEIIKLTRDADVGEVFGTSRIEAVSDRVDGVKKKLDDNDEAIASKAYPLWLFMFGTEENPWDNDDIDNFMEAHEMNQFHPGMKQGVRGDVSVETISGEVADIAESLQFDVDWIMSAMPMPKFALGAFESAVGQIGGIAQQQDINRQINEARTEIEDEFTPLLREVAKQNGVSEDKAEDIYLRIGEPGETQRETPGRESVIRYIPKDQRDSSPDQRNQTVDDGTVSDGQETGDSSDTPDNPLGDIGESEGDVPAEAGALVWHTEEGVEQLSMSTDGPQARLADEIYETMLTIRDETMGEVEQRFADTPTFAATNFERVANRVTRRELNSMSFRSDARDIVSDVISDITGEKASRFSSSQNARFYAQDIENSTEDATEEMLRLIRLQIRRGVESNESWSHVRDRVLREYDESSLRQRAELIAHMEMKNVEETTRLQKWESDSNIVGVRVVNENPSTPLTESLNGAEAHFDEDESIEQQLMSQTREQFLQQGFDPLPPTPPFHFQDTTTLEPIVAE